MDQEDSISTDSTQNPPTIRRAQMERKSPFNGPIIIDN